MTTTLLFILNNASLLRGLISEKTDPIYAPHWVDLNDPIFEMALSETTK